MDYRQGYLRELFDKELSELFARYKEIYREGSFDSEKLVHCIEASLLLAVEKALYDSKVAISDDEFIAACDYILDKSDVGSFGISLSALVRGAREQVNSKLVGRNIGFSKDRASKFLFDRLEEVASWTPNMAFRYGIDEIDDITGGVYPGEIMVLTGHQGSMKTSLILNGVDRALRRHMQVAFFSLDMDPKVLQERRLMRVTGKTQAQLHRELKVKDSGIREQAAKMLRDDDGCLLLQGNVGGNRWTIYTLKDMVEASVPHVLVIDFLTLLRCGGQDDLQCANEVMPIIKSMTQQLGLRTILLSQMGRASKTDQRAGNFGGHSKGGGIIEELADCEIELFKDADEFGGLDKIIATITKNRRGRSGISYQLEADVNTMEFTGAAYEVERQGKGAGKPVFGRKGQRNGEDQTSWSGIGMPWLDE